MDLREQKETKPKQLQVSQMDTIAGWVQSSSSHKPILWVKKLRVREVKRLDHRHTANMERLWGLNPGSADSQTGFCTRCSSCH